MSTTTMEPIRDVLSFEYEKRRHPAAYRDMALWCELGDRAFTALTARLPVRCELTELLIDQCGHCQGVPDPEAKLAADSYALSARTAGGAS